MIARPMQKAEVRETHALATQAGNGVLATANQFGAAFSVPPVSAQFGHPWTPQLGSIFLKMTRGLVDVFTPKLGERVMTDERARLKLNPSLVNEQGESFIVLEVEPDEETGLLTAESRIEIVQTDAVNFIEEKVGRQVLALIIYRGEKPFRAFEVAYFNMRYRRVKPAPGGGPVRHLFL